MEEKIYKGYLDEFGLFHEDENGDIEIRYDHFGNPWCIKHNCKLELCKERH